MNKNPGIEIIAAVSFNTTTQAVLSSYGVVDVAETGVGTATVTLAQAISIDADGVVISSGDDANNAIAVGGAAADELDVTITTAAAGAAADGPVTLIVYRVLPGQGEATYTP